MIHPSAGQRLAITAAAVAGREVDLGPIQRAGDAWKDVDADVADLPVRLVTAEVRTEWPGAPDRLARTDRLTRVALLAARRLVASLPSPVLEADRDTPVGLSFATALATIGTNESFHRRYRAREAKTGRVLADAHLFPYTAPNAAAGELAIAFGLHGPPRVRIAGGRADLEALRVAEHEPQVERWLVVAADVLSPAALRWLAAAGALRDGETASEGAVAFLLEAQPAEPARACWIAGAAAGLDPPSPERATRLDALGLVRFGLAAGLELAEAVRRGDAAGRRESRCVTGAWTALELSCTGDAHPSGAAQAVAGDAGGGDCDGGGASG